MLKNLVRNFLDRYRWGENMFALVEEIFPQARIEDPINGINEVFVGIIRAETYPLEFSKRMIDLGANPNYDDDTPFILLCCTGVISSKYYCDVFKLLLDNGLNVTATQNLIFLYTCINQPVSKSCIEYLQFE